MSTSKRLLIFFMALLITLIFISLVSFIITPLFYNLANETISSVITPIYLTLALLFFSSIQAILRSLFYKKFLSENSILLSIKSNNITVTDRAWFYSLVGVIYIPHIIRGIQNGNFNFITTLLLIITILLVEISLKLSLNTIRINFLRIGIVITGYDIRINFPLEEVGPMIRNDSGYYKYSDIEGYFIFPEHVELFLHREQGSIKLHIDNEEKRQLMGIISQQKIPMKKHI